MNNLFLIIILIILLYTICNNKIKEQFSGMSYINQHKYYKCCYHPRNKYGCDHHICKQYLRQNKSKLILIGVIYRKKKIHKLYKRYNYNTRQYEYLYKIKNKHKDYFFRKINNINYLMNGQKININGKEYIVSLYDNYSNLYMQHHLSKHGYIKLNNDNFYIIYRKINNSYWGRKSYTYYIKINGVLLKLNYQNIDEGDTITIPINSNEYIFHSFDK